MIVTVIYGIVLEIIVAAGPTIVAFSMLRFHIRQSNAKRRSVYIAAGGLMREIDLADECRHTYSRLRDGSLCRTTSGSIYRIRNPEKIPYFYDKHRKNKVRELCNLLKKERLFLHPKTQRLLQEYERALLKACVNFSAVEAEWPVPGLALDELKEDILRREKRLAGWFKVIH